MSEDTALVSRTQFSCSKTQLSCRRMRTQFSCSKTQQFGFASWLQFPFGFASWRVHQKCTRSERMIQTCFSCGGHSSRVGGHSVSENQFRGRHSSGCNSLSGLQVGEKAIQTFLCGGSRLPFGSGAIPFRVCKLAKRRSKRFCAEDRGFLSEAVQFPFGFASWRKGDPNVSVRRIEASFRKRGNSLSGNLRSAPGVHQECTRSAPGVPRSAPGVHQKCTRSAPGVHQNAPGVHQECTRNSPGMHQESWAPSWFSQQCSAVHDIAT